MSLDYKAWGMLAVFGGLESGLLKWTSVLVSREAARTAIGREPDFHDARTTSWGRLTLTEAQRLFELEPDPELQAETLALVREFFDPAVTPVVTLYYTDPNHAY